MSRRAAPTWFRIRSAAVRVVWLASVLAFAALGPALLGACGGGSQYAPEPLDPTDTSQDAIDDVASLGETAEQLEEDLGVALDRTTTDELPTESCEEACNLCLNICDLSDRICHIADDFPENAVLAARCIDAQVRCKRGSRDTALACDCSDVELRIRI